MFIGVSLAVLLSLLWYQTIPMDKQARLVYRASAISIFGSMMMVYWGAQYISSGLVSVLFGLNPIMTTIIAAYFFNQETLSFNKLVGALLGIIGLIIIFFDQIQLGEQTVLGIAAILMAVLLHSASAVWIKHLNSPLPALIITTGGLLYAMPLFAVSFVLFADPLPEQLPEKAFWSIVYLGIMGSVVGFVSYYYVLSKLAVSTVALITLITPVSALILGNWLNHESINSSIISGTACILTGLMMHQFYNSFKNKVQRLICVKNNNS